MNFDPDYVLTEVDQRRIKPLLDDIFDSTIKFTYFLTMTYPYRITDYTEVMKHNRHKLYVLKQNLNQPIKSFTTISAAMFQICGSRLCLLVTCKRAM